MHVNASFFVSSVKQGHHVHHVYSLLWLFVLFPRSLLGWKQLRIVFHKVQGLSNFVIILAQNLMITVCPYAR